MATPPTRNSGLSASPCTVRAMLLYMCGAAVPTQYLPATSSGAGSGFAVA